MILQMAYSTKLIVALLCPISVCIITLGVSWDTPMVDHLHVQPLSLCKDNAARDLYEMSPVESKMLQNHPFCPKRKRRTFPHFSYPATTPRQWQNYVHTTSSNFTRFSIVHPRKSYSVCDELELLIEARNGYDEPKTYGGDLFRAKIFTENESYNASSGTDGEVVDLGNGKYSAFFTLKWTGTVRINVTLVSPSEAVFVMNNHRETLQPRFNFQGKFSKRTTKRNIEEITRCNHLPVDRLISTCNMSDDTVGLRWYCTKPKSPYLSCSDWTAVSLEPLLGEKITDSALSKRERAVINSGPVPILGRPNNVTVNSISGNIVKLQLDRLPPCGQQSDGVQVIPSVAGFYENGLWFPPTCKMKRFPEIEMKKCLADKNIYVYGDSTIRQVYSSLARKLLGIHIFHGLAHQLVELDDRYGNEHNIQMHFGFHHVPIHHTTWHNLTELRFITNELDNIGSNENAVAIICLWGHFQPLLKSFYEYRIESIVSAAQRLLDRNPNSIVMFKGGNTQSPYGKQVKYANDYYARDNEEALRRILKSYPKIRFLDAWDMSTGQLAPANTHPPEPHLTNLIDQILTIVCPNSL